MKIWAECARVDSILARQEVFIIRSDSDQSQIEDFSLTLEEGKGVSRQVQAEHTQIQVEQSGIINRSISRLEERYGRAARGIARAWFGVERDTYAVALDQAKANLAAQQAALRHAHQEYGRRSALGKQAVASLGSVEDRRRNLIEHWRRSPERGLPLKRRDQFRLRGSLHAVRWRRHQPSRRRWGTCWRWRTDAPCDHRRD